MASVQHPHFEGVVGCGSVLSLSVDHSTCSWCFRVTLFLSVLRLICCCGQRSLGMVVVFLNRKLLQMCRHLVPEKQKRENVQAIPPSFFKYFFFQLPCVHSAKVLEFLHTVFKQYIVILCTKSTEAHCICIGRKDNY